MPRYLIAFGSSHPQRSRYLDLAISLVSQHKNICIVGKSPIVKNGSVGMRDNCLFLNCVVAVKCTLHPHVFYRELAAIEHRLGRIRTYRNAQRTIDIDVLLSLDLVYKSCNFFVPHQQMWLRNFFVIPAIEALRSAGWPISSFMTMSRQKFATAYLQPLHQ